MCFRPPQVKKRVRCPKCGFLTNEGDKKCSKCGAEITQKKTDNKGKTDDKK